jgi:WhiB family redox-sensing transcriptional regulator
MTWLRHLNLNKKFIELQKAIIDNSGVECEQVPEVFFPDIHESRQNTAAVRTAKTICNRCIVQDLCLDYALDSNEPYGIWGGLLPEERRSYSSRRRG